MGLVSGRLVINGFDVARRSTRWQRFIIGNMWGGTAGIAFAVVYCWGGNRVLPPLPIPEWTAWIVGFAVADGVATMWTPLSWWQPSAQDAAAAIERGEVAISGVIRALEDPSVLVRHAAAAHLLAQARADSPAISALFPLLAASRREKSLKQADDSDKKIDLFDHRALMAATARTGVTTVYNLAIAAIVGADVMVDWEKIESSETEAFLSGMQRSTKPEMRTSAELYLRYFFPKQTS
jgi:hypothetical protein